MGLSKTQHEPQPVGLKQKQQQQKEQLSETQHGQQRVGLQHEQHRV